MIAFSFFFSLNCMLMSFASLIWHELRSWCDGMMSRFSLQFSITTSSRVTESSRRRSAAVFPE